MLAERVIQIAKRYMRIFEQGGVEDLGEVPREVLRRGGEPDTGDVVKAIDKEVFEPRMEKLLDLLREKLGEDFEVEVGEGLSFDLKDREGDTVVMRFQVQDGEGQVVFVRGDLRLTVSLTPVLNRNVVEETELLDLILESENVLDEIVNALKQFVGEVEEIKTEEGEEPSLEGSEEEEDEERRLGERFRRKVRRVRMSEGLRKFSRLERAKKLKEVLQRLKEEKKGSKSEVDYEVRKIADDKVEYKQVDLPTEGEVAVKALERMKLLDIVKKVNPDPQGLYPNIVGYVQEPGEQ